MFQTRNASGSIQNFESLQEAFEHAVLIDPTVWKVSWQYATGQRCRWIREDINRGN